MARMRSYPKRSWYLHLPHYYDEQERGSIPFTPAVQLYAAFDEALSELLEETVAGRIARYTRAATRLRQGLTALGLKPVLSPELRSNSLTAYYLPAGLPYPQLHDRLKERGYVIYAGQGQLESSIFRVANMGTLTDRDLDGFLGAFRKVLQGTAVGG